MKRVREVLAWPLYFVSFCFHLLCALFQWLGDLTAGNLGKDVAGRPER